MAPRRRQELSHSLLDYIDYVVVVGTGGDVDSVYDETSGEIVFTARCTLVQSAVLRSHVVCLSVRLSVCDVGEL